MKKDHSKISGFHKLSFFERQACISKLVNLEKDERQILENYGYFNDEQLDMMSENVIGCYSLPFSIATNFKINDVDYLIPMVTEEASVVAAASNGARIARKSGGFRSEPVNSIMIGQIQLTNFTNSDYVKKILMENTDYLIKIANLCDKTLVQMGGGAQSLEVREISTERGQMIILHLFVNVLDAMGANTVNTMVEKIAHVIIEKEIVKAQINLKIISNLAIYRVAISSAVFNKDLIGGKRIIERILDAQAFAKADPFRAATANKGIMNGIDALAIATGNDVRAIEAGAHAFASLNGNYGPLTDYYVDNDDNLVGTIEIPMPMATFGGIINKHPMSKIALKILDVKNADELSQIAAALGLAQNFAALRALADEGIQSGHMKLHSRK
ncbi:hydroxymethylglutaryl-CoA reductase, degradative [Promethearchaeum syntrophicum]|uniref:3-hydroxy-3-methylglutaryl coenzyme A reductase n=1 Tax=Promethearchaeum syntrophicum TaxID=2594042 RepID=A0A5B9D972_9ARCH|nr:hydroxymethylglutaryl-CoA reductase, degradative [Candidatus Prometheoarchaeum syntrophicum]QEE15387.1 3-hydroxy-3-methylglutaryl-coenzyme A reductase [Candidatus Prometheoarchaeum syntrophicum]